jgi:phage gp29-like protein
MPNLSTILGPDGQLIDKSTLSQEIAIATLGGARSVLADAVASGLTPEGLAGLLKRASMGEPRAYLTLAEEMEERYLHYASQVQTRRLAIEGTEISLKVPKGVPANIADAVQSVVAAPGFLDAMGSLTDGIAKGYAVVEPIWEFEGGYLRPVEYKWRDPRFFQFDRVAMTELRLAVDGNLDGEPLPPAKFIRHMPRAKTGIPIRRGFARAAAWAFLIQSLTLKDWAAFSETYGMPLRLGKYHSGASDADKKMLLRAVAGISADAAAIVPQGMDIEFIERKALEGSTYKALADYIDQNVSKLVVGQTMTADKGASLAQAKVHNEVRLDIKHADCRQLCFTANNDLIRWFVAMNFGPQNDYPTVEMPVAEPEDTTALATAVEKLVPLGLKVSQREMRGKIGLSEPVAGEELLAPPRQVAPVELRSDQPSRRAAAFAHGTGCACGDCRPAALAADPRTGIDSEAEFDRLLDEGLADWEELADPLLAPLRQALARAHSFDELEALLPQVSRQIDGSKIAARLARLTAIARGLGDVTD